jgi:hypothetical protein
MTVPSKMKKIIFVCLNPVASFWQLDLTPSTEAEVMLIGWSPSCDDPDGGFPDEVAIVLARVLTSIAQVVFPVSEATDTVGNMTRRVDIASNAFERLHARIKHEPVRIHLVSTEEPGVARRMFYDGGFSWQMQGQVGLFLPIGSLMPQFDRRSLRLLIANYGADTAMKLGLNHALGLIRPGVDGAVACIWSFDRAFTLALLSKLKSEAVQMGFEFRMVTEATFTDLLAN